MSKIEDTSNTEDARSNTKSSGIKQRGGKKLWGKNKTIK